MPQLSRIPVSIADVTAVARAGEPVSLTSVVQRDLAASRALFEAARAEGLTLPGRVEPVAEEFTEAEARAGLFARLVGVSRGGSGVDPAIAHDYVTALNDNRRVPVGQNAAVVGISALVVDELARLVNASDFVVALSVSALRETNAGGSASPFSAQIQSAHRSPGQAASASRIRALLSESDVTALDPAAFRSAPQINGALAEAVTALAAAVTLELNSRSDDPLVDLETGSIVSGGNGELIGLTLAFERVRLALGHVAAASEARVGVLRSEPNKGAVMFCVSLPSIDYSVDALGALRLLQLSLIVTLNLLTTEAELASHICSTDVTALTPPLVDFWEALPDTWAADTLLAVANPAPATPQTLAEPLDDEI